MDKSIDKEKRKSRDDRETKHRHHKHRHHDDEDDDDEEYRSRKSRREKSRDRSEERDARREEKSRRERSEERELRREKEREREREKRKVRETGSEDEEEDKKRVRVSESESKKDRRSRRRRRFEDDNGDKASSLSASILNDGNGESQSVTARLATETIPSNNHSVSKVSSISTTNENKGINITGSHEVNGNDKSSTNGTPATAGKVGAPSLDALALAKKTLQRQKELKEKMDKMKKLPMANKGIGASSIVGSQVGKGPVTSTSSAFSSASAAEKPIIGAMDPEKYEAVRRAQIMAQMMGFRQDPEFAPLINMFPGQLPPDVSMVQKPAKPPVLRLDALGREIDEHGNVVNVSKPTSLSTLKVNINKQKKDAFHIEKPDFDIDPEKNPHFDPRMGIDKTKLLRPKRQNFLFVEEGKWSKDAEIIKLKSQFGEAQARELKAKQAQLAKAKAEPNINPNLIEVAERVVTKEKKVKDPIPEVEWWDVSILASCNYPEPNNDESIEAILKKDKITIYVEHPKPIEPPLEAPPPPPQPLKLTKKEQKKLRTQRRLAAEKDKQEMIRQGLIEPPKAKVKMSNLHRVLGSEATQDPTRMEKEIRTAAAEREQAHVDRNIARKLTPAERREKKERKLFDDPTTLEIIVSVYKVNDLSHPPNRFKVDINAQENRLTGCAVIHEGFSVVVVEGGMKSIKRYGKLMLRRINWDAKLEKEDEEDDDEEEKGPNKCVLVWQGSVAKPSFNRFYVHDCSRSEGNARKVFNDAGVGHYWDLAANFVDDEV